MSSGKYNSGKVLTIALLSVLSVVGAWRSDRLVPDQACRFVRYLSASNTPELKATLWERVVYSLVLATAEKRPGANRT
ncbi:MAG TPA: hypothetical protein DEH78_06505 [Solibacterales bacterium]|nr:hypothetical protein [Bryobacterales bacterium]